MLNEILEMFPESEILKADGYDECIIGFDYSPMGDIRLIYSVKKILDNLISEGMDEIDAIEHFEFNMRGGYVGDLTPIWCQDDLVDDNYKLDEETGESVFPETWGNVFSKYMDQEKKPDIHDFVAFLYNNYDYPYAKKK
jgi:hypothetical protein